MPVKLNASEVKALKAKRKIKEELGKHPIASRQIVSRASNRAADVRGHEPPRGVRMSLAFSSAATERMLVVPCERISSTTVCRLDARL
jgi:hypothetical protein